MTMKPEKVIELIEDYVEESEIVSDRRLRAITDRDRYKNILESLREEGIRRISTISGTDMGEEIELIYHVSCGDGVLLDLKMDVPIDDLKVRTITDIFPGAILFERELMDLLGVEIEDHPDPRRLVLADDWPEGKYPLRREEVEEG